MKQNTSQAGFSAVELLVTLFVAAAFLIAGYQLYSVVIQDGGQTRAEAKAANVAYDYLRRATALTTIPCTTKTPQNNLAITVESLSNARITVRITCPNSNVTAMSKVESTMTFNNPQRTVRYATYVSR